ncbi:hypothetical protein N9741_02390 [Octadecabacter sp.]|nr:hypothetical protein [Octadecabacter sp.]
MAKTVETITIGLATTEMFLDIKLSPKSTQVFIQVITPSKLMAKAMFAEILTDQIATMYTND